MTQWYYLFFNLLESFFVLQLPHYYVGIYYKHGFLIYIVRLYVYRIYMYSEPCFSKISQQADWFSKRGYINDENTYNILFSIELYNICIVYKFYIIKYEI